MRFHKVLWSIVLLGCCVYLGTRWRSSAQPPPDPVLDLFRNRVLVPHALPASGVPDPAMVEALENSDIGKAYNAIKPQRSVFICDCGKGSIWCNNPAFNFEAMFTEAAKIANPGAPDPNSLALSWYTSAIGLDRAIKNEGAAFTALKDARFQLLGIANRMDLADPRSNGWSGAEIHFLYGLTPAPQAAKGPGLLVILEFRLPIYGPIEFKTLAQTWANLSSVPDAQYAGRLQSALVASGFSAGGDRPTKLLSVASRINHAIKPAEWQLSQLVLDPKSSDAAAHTAFAPAKLDDQVSAKMLTSQAYLNLWQRKATTLAAGVLHYQLTDDLLEGPFVTYVDSDMGMPTPKGVCNGGGSRDVLALQQCTWCHTTETNTTFVHLSNRLRKDASTPSGFLVGSGNNGTTIHPKLIDLYYGTPSVVWRVKVDYQTYVGQARGPCESTTVTSVSRSFHDVARRTLFLAALTTDQPDLNLPPKAPVFSTSLSE